ncbi:MAG TPA: hypothetical protein EYH06_10120 [Chromatiales bacterium]|nr:hypothetical protein [Thiotrichales bacterium]HIP68925.1 hypothetical protein [Chromatiales bacterium]
MKIKYLCLSFLFALTACGGSGDNGGDVNGGGSNGGGGNSGTEPVGIETRVSNTTCLIHEPVAAGIQLTRKFQNLSLDQPVALLQIPGDNTKWYAVEKAGRVMVFDNDNAVTTASTFIDISARVDSGPNEAGLLGMAFHPDFTTNGEVFLSYTATVNGDLVSRISRFTGNGQSLDPGTEEILLTLTQPFSNHNGGQINFGPDGFLYIGFGDGGSGSDPGDNGQDTQNLLGAFLRINVDQADAARGKPYSIPAANPFASSAACGDAGCPEIYAWGFRNPWRWNFDRSTGALWCGDVGQDEREEVDLVEVGKNYGWRCYEGTLAHNTNGCGLQSTYMSPVAEYDHGQGCSITGGYVYRGSLIPELQGKFIYGDFCSGNIWSVRADSSSAQTPELKLEATGLSIGSFAEDNQGELYALDLVQGGIYKIEPGTSGSASSTVIPDKLSATGCFAVNDPAQAVDALIPYDLNAPLWSDAAEKRRWIALPDAAKIQIDADGDWLFPVGTVLVKEFSLNGKRIETRFLEHRSAGWSGYTYQWTDDQSDALLLDSGKTEIVAGQNWSFPSPGQCLECHTAAAKRALGPETGQLNRSFIYPSSGVDADQIKTMTHIGLLENPPAVAEVMVSPDDTNAPVDLRAKAYLHSNCSHCHRPGGTAGGEIDFRYQTPLEDMKVCDVAPSVGNLGITGAKLLAPSDPARSIIAERVKRLDGSRMPPLGSLVVDTEAATLIDDWIKSISTCP